MPNADAGPRGSAHGSRRKSSRRAVPTTTGPARAIIPDPADVPVDKKRYVIHREKDGVYLEHRATRRVYWYDAATASAACDFFPRHLRLTKGEWRGRPFDLEAWQSRGFIAPLFGWKRVVSGAPKSSWPRRYRKSRMWVPRKNGKTEILAGIANLLLVADGEPAAELYAIASDKNQANIVFKVSQAMAVQSPTLAPELEFLTTSTYCAALAGTFRPLSGKPTGKHGFNPSGCLGDEAHEWESDDLHRFVIDGMSARRQPLDVIISTAGNRNTFGHTLFQECERIDAGVIDDPETLVTIYAADPNDDWQDPQTWAKANPNYGISVKPDAMANEAREAAAIPRLENNFKRYKLNIWAEQDTRWLPMASWRACDLSADGDHLRWQRLFDELRGRKCWGGLDLASIQDITALCWYFPPVGETDRAVMLWRFWVPGDGVAVRSKRDGIPYDQWVASGAITATEGNITDYNRVRRDIDDDRQRFDVQAIGLDKFNSSQMVIDLMADGAPAKWFPQSMMSMSPPSKQLERLVLSKNLDHGGHPVARWMASNAAIISDHNDNIRPSKEKSSEKIDGIAAAVMAIGMTLGEAVPDSYMATTPIMIL